MLQHPYLSHDAGLAAGHRAALVDSSYGPCSGEMCQLAGCRCGNGAADASDVGAMDLLQQHVGPLLQKYRVTLAFWGHNHAYQVKCRPSEKLFTLEWRRSNDDD